MTEKPAENIRGFFLYSPFTRKYFFRVYDDSDSYRRTFKDYDVCAEDIEVTIHAGGLALYETGDRNRLDWSSETLGKDLVAGPSIKVGCKEENCDEQLEVRTYNKPLTLSIRCPKGHRHSYSSPGTVYSEAEK